MLYGSLEFDERLRHASAWYMVTHREEFLPVRSLIDYEQVGNLRRFSLLFASNQLLLDVGRLAARRRRARPERADASARYDFVMRIFFFRLSRVWRAFPTERNPQCTRVRRISRLRGCSTTIWRLSRRARSCASHLRRYALAALLQSRRSCATCRMAAGAQVVIKE